MNPLAAAAVLAALATAPAPRDAAREEVRAQVERAMNAFAALDLPAFQAELADEVDAFEVDLENKPVRLAARADVLRFAESAMGELKKMGARVSLDVRSRQCRLAAPAAWCTVEFDFVAAMPDGSRLVQPTRNTIVLRRTERGWKWVHWHSSAAAAPPAH